jgi:hypothetical protein
MSFGIFGMMFLIMFALKLAGPMAAVSWAVVTAPLWVPVLIGLCVFLIGACFASYK